jgi:hypothetical protein
MEQQAKKIIEKLEIQLRAYPNEIFGILCPRSEDVDQLWSLIASSPLGTLCSLQKGGDHSSFDPGRPIIVGTFHSSKGVEFRSVHLAACESLKRFRLQRNMSYMAVTRCKTSLSIYYSDDLPGYFEKALVELGPARDLPKIKDVFSGRRA